MPSARVDMDKYRYQVIAWDGCGRWKTEDAKVRKTARAAKIKYRYFWTLFCYPLCSIKIWDRKRKEFIY